jgi:hypothetical protein
MNLEKKHIKYITLLLIIIIGGVLIYLYYLKNKKKAVVKPTRSVDKNNNYGLIVTTNNNPVPTVVSDEVSNETKVSSSDYVGPQDCAENCNRPYNNYILSCYKKHTMPGIQLDGCLQSAEKNKQDCLGKCSEAIPRYKDLTQDISTPLQEENYFSNLFKQGYV